MTAHVIRDWPAALDAEESVSYTGLAREQIMRASKDGRLKFQPLGPRGKKVCLRSQLDGLLQYLFSTSRGEPVEDMDFGDD